MSVNAKLRDATVAISVLEGARDACVSLKPLAMLMTPEELQHRAEVVAHVVNARAKMQLFSQRADQLRGDSITSPRRHAMKG